MSIHFKKLLENPITCILVKTDLNLIKCLRIVGHDNHGDLTRLHGPNKIVPTTEQNSCPFLKPEMLGSNKDCSSIEWTSCLSTKRSIACENIRFSSLFVAGDVSRGGTSATQRQKFHTDDANQCLHDKSGSHGVSNTNLSNFTCLLVDFG